MNPFQHPIRVSLFFGVVNSQRPVPFDFSKWYNIYVFIGIIQKQFSERIDLSYAWDISISPQQIWNPVVEFGDKPVSEML